MSRKLIVEVIGDTSSLDKSLTKATGTTQKFGVSLKSLAKGGLAAGVGFTAASEGIGLVFDALGKSITAAEDAQKAHAFVNQAFKNAGLSAKTYAKEIDKAGQSAIKLGFDDEAAQVSLAKFVQAGQNVGQAMREVSIAEDLARAKNISLEASTQILTGALAGNQRAVKQLGIVVPPVTSAVDKLRAAHAGVKGPIDSAALAHAKLQDKLATGNRIIDIVSQKVKGQGDAFAGTAAGGMARFRVQVENIEEAIGNKLLPVMTSMVGFINDNWSTIGTVISDAFNFAKIAIESFIAPMKTVWDLVHGDWAGAWDAFSAPAIAAWDAIKAVLQPLIDIINGGLTAAFNAIQQTASTVWSAVSGAVTTAISTIKTTITGALTGAFNDAKSLGGKIVSGIADGLSGFAGAVSSKVSAGVGKVTSFFVEAFNKASDLGGKVVSGITSGLAGAAGAVKTGVMAGINSIAGLFKAAYDEAVKLGGKIVSGLKWALDKIKLPGFSVEVPYPTVSVNVGTGSWHGIPYPTVDVSFGLGHHTFSFPAIDPNLDNFAVGGQVPGASGPVPIMAHAGEFVLRAAAVKALGVDFLHGLNRFDWGGIVDPESSSGSSGSVSGTLGPDLLGDSAYAAALRKRHGPWEPPKRWAPDEMRTGSVFRNMLERRYGGNIHFEDAWVQALYHANAGQIMSAGLSRPPFSISDLTSGQVWYDFPGGAWALPPAGHSLPSFAGGGIMQRDGLAYLHAGETVTPGGGGTTHITVQVGSRVIGEIAMDELGKIERFGGPIKIRRS